MLGRYLIAGEGGTSNKAEGLEWLERAMAQGVAEAEYDITAEFPLAGRSAP
jgi:TPR repeat protein